jgi:hypothetical protein
VVDAADSQSVHASIVIVETAKPEPRPTCRGVLDWADQLFLVHRFRGSNHIDIIIQPRGPVSQAAPFCQVARTSSPTLPAPCPYGTPELTETKPAPGASASAAGSETSGRFHGDPTKPPRGRYQRGVEACAAWPHCLPPSGPYSEGAQLLGGRMPKNAINPTDKHVGARVRMRRLMLGMVARARSA